VHGGLHDEMNSVTIRPAPQQLLLMTQD